MKAYAVRCAGFSILPIYAAENKNGAKKQAFRAAKDAGYDVQYTDFGRTKRLPEYDELAAQGGERSLGSIDTASRQIYGAIKAIGAPSTQLNETN